MAASSVKLFYNDFFIHGDFNCFLQLFPHLTIDLYAPELEVNRVKGIDHKRVNLTLHANGLEALAEVIAQQADELPMIVSSYELHWQANREAISAKYAGDNLYQSCWFSSLVIALRHLRA
jgi:hypothetical protein